jgi:hypothetical protein
MTRRALPQNYLLDPGTLVEDFEDNEGAVIYNGTKADNTTEFKTGTKSIKLTVDSGAVGVIEKITDFAGLGEHIGLWMYCHTNPTDTIDTVYVRFYAAGSGNYAITKTNYYGYRLKSGWNYIPFKVSEFTLNGSIKIDDNIVKIRIYVGAIVGQQPIISVDSFYIRQRRKAKLLFTFDGADDSVYTEGYAYMSARNLPGTIYVTNIYVDYVDMCTKAQLTEMYNAGWAISNHSMTHTAFSAKTQEEIEAELSGCTAWLNANGFTRASSHVAYPSGMHDVDTLAAMTASGMLTGRTTVAGAQPTPGGDIRLLTCHIF